MPTARTVTNWLRRFTHATLRPLIQLNQELVLESLARLDVPRLTIDVDGTVVRTGATVAWAFLTIGRISATTPWGPTSRRPATACDSRTARATCTTPSSRPRSCGS